MKMFRKGAMSMDNPNYLINNKFILLKNNKN